MNEDLSELLFNALNEQGYLFQEACEHALKENEEGTGWEVKASDYPVSIQEQDTKVDIVLRSKISSSPELFALLECKRADPSYVYWLFGAPGLPFGNALFSALGFECHLVRSDSPHRVDRLVERLSFKVSTHGVESWLEVKKGTGKRASNPQNIENAFMQVLRGIGGFAQEQLIQRHKNLIPFKTFFVPVVVTTAKLYVAYYEVKNIDLSSGTINKDRVTFGSRGQPAMEVDWVLLDYGIGRNIDEDSVPKSYIGVNPNELLKYKTRSIFVVNSDNLVLFFSKLHLIKE
jgi:hypothetical protein